MMDESMVLADLRREAGLTQSQVGARMGKSQQQVDRYEAQYPNVPFDTVRRYIEAVGGQVMFRLGGRRTVNAHTVVADPVRAHGVSLRRADPTRRARAMRRAPESTA